MEKYCFILIVGFGECGFEGPSLTQVSLFHQPHPLHSHMHNLGITSNTNRFFCTNDFQLDLQYERPPLEFGRSPVHYC